MSKKCYLVGGAVRDIFMGLNPQDMDFVWTGAMEADMLARCYTKVAADFPVYLDEFKNEHALARRERKTGTGYHGFEVDFSPDVTIEEDLSRRDLTINSMAIEQDLHINLDSPLIDRTEGSVVDPFNGRADIMNKIIRHTNADAFKEDPVRVLRVARFLARWKDFEVAPETFKLLQEMAESGELTSLQPDRVWKETEKALKEEQPSRYFIFLRMIGALKYVFPEVDALFGVPQPYKYHPEGDCFIHTMMVLDAFSSQWLSPVGRFAALCHDLGKATSDPANLPSHFGHEQRGVGIVEEMAKRLPLPNEYVDIAKAVAAYHTHIHNFDKLNHKTIVNMFDNIPYRKYNGNVLWILPAVSEADHKGRTSFFAARQYPNYDKATGVFAELERYKTSDHIPVDEIKAMKPERIRDFNYRTKIAIVSKTRAELK